MVYNKFPNYRKRFNSLKSEYVKWYSTYKDIANYVDNTKGNFSDNPSDVKLINGQDIVDTTAMKAVRIFASGMMSGLTSPSREWFKIRLKNINIKNSKDIMLWLEEVERRMYSVFESSNIYGILNSIYEEIAIFGTASAIILSDIQTIIRGRNFTAGEFFLGSDSFGRVNTFCREYWMTIGQMAEEFGEENHSDNSKNLYLNKEYDKWIKINHIITPNEEYIPNSEINNKFISIYWESSDSENKCLAIKYFSEFPILAPRWEIVTTSDIYGKSPSWRALPEIKMLQKLQKDKLIGLDKLINPPVQIDSMAQLSSVNLMPSGITRVNSLGSAGIKPVYQVAPDLNSLQSVINETRESIMSSYYADLFLMITNIGKSGVTATEIAQRSEEKILMIGSVIDRLKNELLNPLISRTFNLMYENGMIPEIPEEIQAQEIRVEYISVLAQAQKMVGISSLERTTQYVASLSQINPAVLDVFDMDKAIKIHGEMTGVPPSVLRSDEEIDTIRQQRMQSEQTQSAIENMQNLSKVSKDLSKSKVDDKNVLSELISGGDSNVYR